MSAGQFVVILAHSVIFVVAALLIGISIVFIGAYAKLIWRGLLENALRGKGRSRWRIEEVRCNKCQNSPEPGFLHYESFNPATGDVEQARFACDRCKQTGTIKIVVMADDATHDEHERIAEELRELGHIALLQPDRIKRESEVSETNE